MRHTIFFGVLCLFCGPAVAYKAAVVEYHPSTGDSPRNTILTNIEGYRRYVNNARIQGVDIIVFPEYGLTTLVNDPEEFAINIPDDQIITELRAIAQEHKMYLVVNLLEQVKEPNKTTRYYNTNLVFDRSGEIVLKYRKINLYDESKLTPGDKNQTIVFITDFYVTFAIFTCYDIVFAHPSRTVLNNAAVTDVIFTSAWISVMPLYTSLSVQYGYSISTGVNLLAANYGDAKNAHGGSGIYLGSGRIAEDFIDEGPNSKLIVQKVPTNQYRVNTQNCTSKTTFGLPGPWGVSNISNFVTMKDLDLNRYRFQNVDVTKKSFISRVCDGAFCCQFNLQIDTTVPSKEIFKVAVFDGDVKYDNEKVHVRFCSLLVCENDSKESCGARLNTTTRFTRLTVSGNLDWDNTTFYTPVTLNYNLQPVTDINYCSTHNETRSTFVKLETTGSQQQQLLVFGLFGRTSSASQFCGLFSLVVLGVLKCVLLK